ncbi:MAG: ATP synthase subunit I [Acidobacteria bacterium]|nr:ATP synthase subunit I [Acidobacteriota bacterium]
MFHGNEPRHKEPQEVGTALAPLERRILRNGLAAAVLLALLGLWKFGPWIAACLLLGVGLATLNFFWLKQGVDLMLKRGTDGAVRWAIIKFVARLSLILVVLFATIKISVLSMMATLVGLAVFLLGAVIEAFRSAFSRANLKL